MGEWQKAADYATKVIGSEKFSLWTAEQYKTVWGAEKGSGEVIFEVYGKRTNAAWGSWEDLSYLTYPEGSGDAQAADPLIKTYEEGDVRLALYAQMQIISPESNGQANILERVTTHLTATT